MSSTNDFILEMETNVSHVFSLSVYVSAICRQTTTLYTREQKLHYIIQYMRTMQIPAIAVGLYYYFADLRLGRRALS